MLKAMAFSSLFFLAFKASSIAHAMLYALSGAGRNPFDLMKSLALSKTCFSSTGYATAFIMPLCLKRLIIGAAA